MAASARRGLIDLAISSGLVPASTGFLLPSGSVISMLLIGNFQCNSSVDACGQGGSCCAIVRRVSYNQHSSNDRKFDCEFAGHGMVAIALRDLPVALWWICIHIHSENRPVVVQDRIQAHSIGFAMAESRFSCDDSDAMQYVRRWDAMP